MRSPQSYAQIVDNGSMSGARRSACVRRGRALFSRAPGSATMKPEIHPNYADIKVVCSCGNESRRGRRWAKI